MQMACQPDSYGYSHLIDPEFINANARSLLQRAREAQIATRLGDGVRFKLVTIGGSSDPLREMVGSRSGAMRLERLYGSLTDNSKAGAVRKAWREHLGYRRDELRLLARTLAFGEATDSLDAFATILTCCLVLLGFAVFRQTRVRSPMTTSSSSGWRKGASSSMRGSFGRSACGRVCSEPPRAGPASMG